MVSVKARNSHLLLPAALSAGSFFILIAIMLLTDPVKDISYAIVYFGALLIFLISLGCLALMYMNKLNSSSRSKIVITSVVLVIFVMFRSAGSLSWVDFLVLLLLTGGLFFYTSHRA